MPVKLNRNETAFQFRIFAKTATKDAGGSLQLGHTVMVTASDKTVAVKLDNQAQSVSAEETSAAISGWLSVGPNPAIGKSVTVTAVLDDDAGKHIETLSDTAEVWDGPTEGELFGLGKGFKAPVVRGDWEAHQIGDIHAAALKYVPPKSGPAAKHK
jgi:hypothetical protein